MAHYRHRRGAPGKSAADRAERRGTTVFLTTHYIEEAERLCHRIAFIVEGRIVRSGSLMSWWRWCSGIGAAVYPSRTGARLSPGIFMPAFQVSPASTALKPRIRTTEEINLYPLVEFFEQQQRKVYEARVIRPSLEEVFVRVTGLELEKMKQEKGGCRG